MKQEWELLKVGMRRGEWIGLPDGLVMEWTDECGLMLHVFLNRPSVEEKTDMCPGRRLEIAFKNIDGIGFFAVKFGEQLWADCCFSPDLYRDAPQFDKPQEGLSYALHVMLVDTSMGELKLLRTVALGKEFAEHFRLWALGSLKKNIGLNYYNQVVNKVFAEYPKPEALAETADVRWVSSPGEDEHKREEKWRK